MKNMNVSVTVELSTRVYSDIESFCKTNGLVVEEYLVRLIEEQHLITKYGDINEKLSERNSKTVAKRKTVRKKKTEEVDNGEDMKIEETPIQEHKVVRRKRNIEAK